MTHDPHSAGTCYVVMSEAPETPASLRAVCLDFDEARSAAERMQREIGTDARRRHVVYEHQLGEAGDSWPRQIHP
jgi:hypothetical protein